VSTPTILITGATDGHGRALADRLAGYGATLVLHGRDAERLDRAADEIAAGHDTARPQTVLADLADLAQVRRLVAGVREGTDRLDVLVSNAGIGFGEPDGRTRRVSADGYELRFAVNYLAGFLLTALLCDRLVAGAPSRMVNVASAGQMAIDFGDVMLEHGYSGARAYCQSKLAQIMHAFDLAEKLGEAGVTANALHPGSYMPTKMVRAAGTTPVTPLEDGVEATWRLAADPALDGVTGRYFFGSDEARADEQAYDADARRRLRELSERLVGL